MRFPEMRGYSFLLAGIALASQSGFAQVSPPTSEATEDRWVVTSFAGGIAKGSYQGGVDYVISEFLRRRQRSDFVDLIGDRTLPMFRLGASTGASAGNINALFGALAWCTDSLSIGGSVHVDIPPEQSLFWQIWVRTGFPQMLPATGRRDNSELAVLDRSFFENDHKRTVERFLAGANPRAGCRIPLGVTMTKIVPITVRLDDHTGEIAVQRFAAVMNVKSGATERRWLDFQSPDSGVQRAASLGALALFDILDTNDESARGARFDAVFNAVLASSSFPIAFAPRRLCYKGGGLAANPVRPAEPCALFNDGGVFDNNPVGLALRLFDLRRDEIGSAPDTVYTVFSNPMRYRGTYSDARYQAQHQQDNLGLAAILQMLVGAWTAATEYELQALARQLARDTEMRRAEDRLSPASTRLLPSSRSGPIMGEQLGSFGGFLGRAFREYDFYMGVYDGLEFLARNFICWKTDTASQAARDSCTQGNHSRLVKENIFGLSAVADSIMNWHHAIEYGGTPYRPVRHGAPPNFRTGHYADSAQARLAVLIGIHNAMQTMRRPAGEYSCRPRNDPLLALMCPSGLDRMVRALRSDTVAFQAIRHLRQLCDADSVARKNGDCVVDSGMVDFVENPKRHLDRLVERALSNLAEAEDAIKERAQGTPQYSAYVKAAFAQYRAMTFRYRTGLERNPSTARWDMSGPSRIAESILATVLPNYVTGGFGALQARSGATGRLGTRSTALSAGWRPLLLRTWEPLYVTSLAEWSRYSTSTGSGRKRDDLALGAAVGTTVWTVGPVSSIELGFIAPRHLLADESDAPIKRRIAYQLTTRLVTEKIYASIRYAPDYGYAVNLGLSDLNGIVYWIIR